MDSNPDSDHLSHVDCDPDSNPDSGPGARVNAAYVYVHYWRSERSELSHSQFVSIEICGICRYCTCNAGSKFITFAASAIF